VGRFFGQRASGIGQRLAFLLALFATSLTADPYTIGSITVRDVFVDPVAGNDSNDGNARATALRTLTAAWNRIPQSSTLTSTGYRIQLMAGTHPRASVPNYFESRYGTAQFPIIIQSADASRSAHVLGDFNVFDTRYLYLIGLDLTPDPPGDVVHCEKCDHLLIRDCHLSGGARQAQETLKVNQSQNVYVESSTIHGAYDNNIDFVSVQYGHIIDNQISDAEDWCVYTKGGSAYFRVEGNDISQCGTGGFTAGQGTGFQFMTPPWIHYEAYDIKVLHNVIHDTQGAGLGVNGGYDILLAHNTLYRIGSRSHLLEVVYGARSCDGQPGDPTRQRCTDYLALGGWGTTVVDDGTNYTRIPNRNVYVYNNLIYNPPGFTSPQHFTVAAPLEQTSPPAIADTNLRIRGNVIFNGDVETPLGVSDDTGCDASNPTCNDVQLRADNTINTLQPQVASDLHPIPGSNLFSVTPIVIPDFAWSDAPTGTPTGSISNAGLTSSVVGAFGGTTTPTSNPRRRTVRH